MTRPAQLTAPRPAFLGLIVLLLLGAAEAGATTYYVSAAAGSDDNTGTTPATAFATVAHVNTLSLQPGDEVRFVCGEVWRADPLVVTRSGAAGAPIVFSSYPSSCAAKPLLSGAQPIAGWTPDSGNVCVADLGAGANAGRFPLGLTQLFRGASRLPMGRWPDLEGHPDGGYAEVDSQPALDQVVDAELPAVDWTGAVMHLKSIRWYIMNREVVATSGTTLTLGADAPCWNGCAGWGYWLNSHRATLDREGEWYYDEATNRVYLYTELGPPADGEIEGSAILPTDGDYGGGVVLGKSLAWPWGAQLGLVEHETSAVLDGNVLFALASPRRALSLEILANVTASDNNYFFNPYDDLTIAVSEVGPVAMALADWQSYSGRDGNSTAHWYTLGAADPPRSEIFVNETAAPVEVDLGGAGYLDLDQQPVGGSITLAPYSSRVLVRADAFFSDGFESGDTSRWRSTMPQ